MTAAKTTKTAEAADSLAMAELKIGLGDLGLGPASAVLSDADIQFNPDLEVRKAEVAAQNVRIQPASGPAVDAFMVFATEADYQAHLNNVTKAVLAKEVQPYREFETAEELSAYVEEQIDEFANQMFRIFVSPAEFDAYMADTVNEAMTQVDDLVRERVASWRAEAQRQDALSTGDPTKKAYFNFFADDLDGFLTGLIPSNSEG